MHIFSKTARILLATSAFALLAGGVQAQTRDPQKMAEALEQRFKAADKDQNGLLTQAEADAGMPRLAKVFDKIDTEKKGNVSLDQIKTYVAQAAAKRK
ncbi:MAG: hypothetical protein ACKVOO_12770 [Burkholderiaceae bacterium]